MCTCRLKIFIVSIAENKDLDVSSLRRQLMFEALLSSNDLDLVFDGGCPKFSSWSIVISFHHSCCESVKIVSGHLHDF